MKETEEQETVGENQQIWNLILLSWSEFNWMEKKCVKIPVSRKMFTKFKKIKKTAQQHDI